MKALIILVTLVGLGATALTIFVGARVMEPTVVANPYEEGLRYDETRRKAEVSTSTALTLDVSPRPPRAMSELEFTVRATRAGRPLEGAEVSLALTMPGMHMGENRVALAPAGGGVYRGKGVVVRCPSGGRRWEAEVTARAGDGGTAVATFPFEVAER